MGKTQTFGKGNVAKERRKSLKLAQTEEKERTEREFGYSGKEKLLFEIGKLKSTIKLCKHDLQNFPGNGNIILKLKVAEDTLKDKQEELNKIEKNE